MIFQWADVTELLHTLGVKVEEVKSGPLKAVPSPFEPTDEKARALAEEMVQEAKVWFVDLVADRRKIEPSAVPGLTDGRIYSGRQAVEFKLVDQIGDEQGGDELAHQGAQRSGRAEDRRLEADAGKRRPVRLAVPLHGLALLAFPPEQLPASPAKSRHPQA